MIPTEGVIGETYGPFSLQGRKQAMQFFNIPDNVIDGVASEIHNRTTKDYHIPIVGTHLEISKRRRCLR